MKKIEQVYAEILKREVVNRSDLDEIRSKILGPNQSYKYFYNQYLSKLLRENKLVRIRQGCYSGINVYSDENQPPDKYLIASKLRPRYYLGYHTALELHGCAYSHFNRTYIVTRSTSKFEPFSFQTMAFQPIINRNVTDHIDRIKYNEHRINISNPSRTFIECLDRPDLAGGWEEVLKSLDSLGNVKLSELLPLLKFYNKLILYRKCGYVLDILMDQSPYYQHLTRENGLPPIPDTASKLFIEKNNRTIYVPKWKLFTPFDFEGLLRGI